MELIYRQESDRWIKGDSFVRPIVRNLIKRKTHYSGMELVVKNFMEGLTRKGIEHSFNKFSLFLKKEEKIISFGLGEKGLIGVKKQNPVIAAIGFPYPAEIPDLCERYNIVKYLQHSQWALDLAKSAKIYPDSIFDLWPAGVDTLDWIDTSFVKKEIDVLIYDKLYWKDINYQENYLNPIIEFLKRNKFSYQIVKYGNYLKGDYQSLLTKSKAMIFLSAHETQGFAYLEALASNVPVYAWNQGYWLDPIRFEYQKPIVPASSLPFFDERCGDSFKDQNEFEIKFLSFMEKVNQKKYAPRDYVLENLTIEKSTDRMLEIFKE